MSENSVVTTLDGYVLLQVTTAISNFYLFA